MDKERAIGIVIGILIMAICAVGVVIAMQVKAVWLSITVFLVPPVVIGVIMNSMKR